MIDAVWQDLRYAVRALRSSPGFAAVAILSLALGIGANTAIFSLIDAVMLKSLPVRHPEQLFRVTMGRSMYWGFNNPIWEEVRDRQDVFSGIFAYGRWAFNLAAGGEARTVNGHYVSGQYFDTLGVHAVLGRTLTPADDVRGCAGAAVLSYEFWQREYGGPDVLGKTISIDRHPIEIVGVAEPGFTGVEVGTAVHVMVPLCTVKIIQPERTLLESRFLPGWLQVVGRLKPGVSATQATARLNTLAPAIYRATLPPNLTAEDRERHLRRTFDTEPADNGISYLRGQYGQALMILMTIAGLVLLIACANVANLLLARGAVRRREIAIRMALGCGRGRLVRQLLTESLLLSTAGAAAGAVLARSGASLLVRFLDAYLDLAVDGRMLAFTTAVAVFTGLLFGIAPAWRGTRIAPQSAMKAGAQGSAEGSRLGLGKILVVGQVGLSLLLVVGAGLMLSTFWTLASLDAGFDRGQVLLASVDFRTGNSPPQRRLAAYREMLEKVRAIPGVRSASASRLTPICHCMYIDEVAVEGYAAKSRADATVYFNQVSDRYFETLGTAMVSGRDFNDRDTPASPRVAIINQTMARKYFGGKNPLGLRYRVRRVNELSDPVEIVGVVKDAKYGSLRDEIPPTIFTAWSQDKAPEPITNFEVRVAAGAPLTLVPGVKSAIGEVNRDVSLEFKTLAVKVNESLEREQLLATLSGLFGGLALLLGTVGLYGLMSYSVARRRKEIGIRMALGAERNRVVRMVLGEVALLVGVGLAVGLGAAVATTRLVANFLYGLRPNDPVTLFMAAAVLAGVALGAGYVPARRASKLHPMTALREE
ncbi:MAG TPA: ABC transporter permease [Bryobacteraceae bacterium]